MSTGNITLTYGNYDAANRPQAFSYSLNSRTYTENLTYKENGSVERIDLPTQDITFNYNNQGRLASATSESNTFNFYYDSRGLPQALDLPGGSSMDYTYYKDGRPKDVTLEDTIDAETAQVSLSYDPYGKIDTLTRDTGLSDKATGTYTYSYDRIGRLSSATCSKAAIPDYAYTYDKRGPVSEKKEITKLGETPPTITTDYVYDDAGRLDYDDDPATPEPFTNDYTYDAAGRLTQATGTRGLSNMAYDGLNRMVAATGSGGSVTYTYDQMGRMVIREKTKDATSENNLFLPFSEPPRVSWRLLILRGWSYEYTQEISTRVEGTGGAHGLRPRTGVRVRVGCDPFDRNQVRHDG
jgi:YD repeat-containing protein